MKPPVNESIKCTQFIRKIPLESFRLSGDGRKWKQAARSRQDFLIWLSTWANGDGTFIGTNGIDYSPSEKTITKHLNRKSYYRMSEALRQLGWLSWTRKQNHYGRRLFRIHLDNHPPDLSTPSASKGSPRTGDTFKAEQVTGSPETGDIFVETHPHDGYVITHPHHGALSVLPSTAPENAENPRALNADGDALKTSALPITGAAAGDNLTAAATAATPHAEHPAGHLPSNTTGGLEGARGDQQHAEVEWEPADPVTEETVRQIRKQSQKEYGMSKAEEYRALSQTVRDQVTHLVKRCKAEWEYWRFRDEEGDDISARFPALPSPKSDHMLKLAELLNTYTTTVILEIWEKFVNRPDGFDGMEYIWANFFLEFDYYVAATGGAA